MILNLNKIIINKYKAPADNAHFMNSFGRPMKPILFRVVFWITLKGSKTERGDKLKQLMALAVAVNQTLISFLS